MTTNEPFGPTPTEPQAPTPVVPQVPQQAATESPFAAPASPYVTAPTVPTPPAFAPVPPSAQHFAAPAPAAATAKKSGVAGPVILSAALAAVLASGGTAALLLGPLNNQLARDGYSHSSQNHGSDNGYQSQGKQTSNTVNQNVDWQDVAKNVAPSVVAITVTTNQGAGQGSGVIIDAQGHILTNNHVVESGTNGKITVTMNDGTLHEAKITGLDAATDLAIIQLVNPPTNLTVATFADSSDVVVGQPVMAMGNPLGLSQTATTGIVSALNRPVATAQTADGTLVVTNALQIDAAINPGNSGGPLFNVNGEVIGITSSIATLSGGSGGQNGSIGLGFAIPGNLATSIGKQLIETGTAQHAFLGVAMVDGTATVGSDTRTGALVKQVTDGSPAAKAGLKVDDVIVTIDGNTVTGSESLTGYVRELAAGDTVKLGVVRDGKLTEVTATLAQKQEQATSVPQQGNGQDGSGQGGSQNGSDKTSPNNIPDLGKLFPNFGG